MNWTGYPSRRLAVNGLLTALAICVNQLEGMFPHPLPGVKLGLANALGLAAFGLFDFKDAVMVSTLRVITVGLTFSGLGLSFGCSLAGVGCSMVVLLLLGRLWPERLSLWALGQAMAMGFNLGQLAVVAWAVSSPSLFLSYLPIMAGSSLVTGFATGTMAGWLMRKAGASKSPGRGPI
ncbi:Gx transporter family protein [Thermanaerovibrio acidaminovorans]|jgi:heptaprenyl diphosphate synthase|uniref:Heptaprenyl diphosphate synthase component I n=1 Tax=Thermanaerovibrio acidaminovorans (strain ATCC 49978 / DSM 6589 / Su883) TaxID=525903 RepID=D1B8I2_THEAS|nr:Gx transporter family protein [Thermanaerovibrio acidaminovorans]ACZ18585.1 Heptaprenyl diphosphate synthase component I [Thermanaerovibrio acidaminovorans DSM 6589]